MSRKDVNQVTVSGYLTKDPVINTFVDSKKEKRQVAHFWIAISRGQRKNDKGKYIDIDAYFYNIQCWDYLASIVDDYYKKGHHVSITGSLFQKTFKRKDGSTAFDFGINADSASILATAKMVGKKGDTDSSSDENPAEPELPTEVDNIQPPDSEVF